MCVPKVKRSTSSKEIVIIHRQASSKGSPNKLRQATKYLFAGSMHCSNLNLSVHHIKRNVFFVIKVLKEAESRVQTLIYLTNFEIKISSVADTNVLIKFCVLYQKKINEKVAFLFSCSYLF